MWRKKSNTGNITGAVDIILQKVSCYSVSKSMMILRRLGRGDEAYCTYVEEADDPDKSGPTKIALDLEMELSIDFLMLYPYEVSYNYYEMGD